MKRVTPQKMVEIAEPAPPVRPLRAPKVKFEVRSSELGPAANPELRTPNSAGPPVPAKFKPIEPPPPPVQKAVVAEVETKPKPVKPKPVKVAARPEPLPLLIPKQPIPPASAAISQPAPISVVTGPDGRIIIRQ